MATAIIGMDLSFVVPQNNKGKIDLWFQVRHEMSGESKSRQIDILLVLMLVFLAIAAYELLLPVPPCNLIPGFCPWGYPYRTTSAYLMLSGGVIIILLRTTRQLTHRRSAAKKSN